MENKEKLKEHLKSIYYDKFGQYFWSQKGQDGGSEMVAQLRGWGAIQQQFGTHKECAEFQDQVGKFIADAINEKVQREF